MPKSKFLGILLGLTDLLYMYENCKSSNMGDFLCLQIRYKHKGFSIKLLKKFIKPKTYINMTI